MQSSERTSKTSAISYWLGILGLPAMIVSMLLHRIGAIESNSLGMSILVISILGQIGFLAALHGLTLFWRGKISSIKECTIGLILSCILLLPAGVSLVGAMQHPPLNDITTDFNFPPSIIIGNNEIDGPIENKNRLQQEYYPDIQHRQYGLNLNNAYQIAVLAADKMGWVIVFDRSKVNVESIAWFQAEARTSLIGFVDDVSVRFQSLSDGVRLDVRSRSRFGRYDFGKNAKRIREFFAVFEDNLE